MTLLEDLKKNFRKDGTKEWHRGKIVSSLIVVLGLFVFIIYKNQDLNEKAAERLQHIRYTIGVTGKKHHNIKSSQPIIEYFFEVGNQKFTQIEHIGASFESSVIENGGRYFVEFSSVHPNNSKLRLDYPVPDSITSVPDLGWTSMPDKGSN